MAKKKVITEAPLESFLQLAKGLTIEECLAREAEEIRQGEAAEQEAQHAHNRAQEAERRVEEERVR